VNSIEGNLTAGRKRNRKWNVPFAKAMHFAQNGLSSIRKQK
jgi:hypothetical protein